jgi:hypothetical protein
MMQDGKEIIEDVDRHITLRIHLEVFYVVVNIFMAPRMAPLRSLPDGT